MTATRRWIMGAMAALGWTGASRAATAEPVKPAPFPYPVVTVDGAKALEEWTRLKDGGVGWPIVLGNDEDLAQAAELLAYYHDDMPARTPEVILKAAAALRFPDDLKALRAREDSEYPQADLGDWPAEVAPEPELSVASDILTGKPYPKVHIALLPAAHPWEVAAYLQWGGSNACPLPEYHVAAFRSWYERYGAEPVGMSGDVINLRIARPVSGKDEALAVAREQYLYCPDIVEQGTNTLSVLAAGIQNGRWWYFWWD